MIVKRIKTERLSRLLLALALSFSVSSSDAAQSKSLSLAELALYQGADREKILLEGAKKEGQVTFYTSTLGSRVLYLKNSRRNIPSSKPTFGAATRNHC